jgi:class 3 adenylate cyclase
VIPKTVPPPPSETPAAASVLELLRSWDWRAVSAEFQSAAPTPGGALILGWNAIESGDFTAARAQLERAASDSAFRPWALAGQATVAMRSKEFARAHKDLDELSALASDAETDPLLAAIAAHIRGSAKYHQGEVEAALVQFERALRVVPPKHILRARILDSLGMHYAGVNNFTAAREFFAESLKRKEKAGDANGIAFTHGSLGRLMLDWGYSKEARAHFLKDLELVRGRDRMAEAQMYNFLGRCDLLEGRWHDAAGWLDESIARAGPLGVHWIDGFARKDRALVHLAVGELAPAAEQLERAAALLDFPEGQAHANRALALLRRAQGRFAEAETLLHAALTHFEAAFEMAEAAQTVLEEARTLRARGAPATVVRHALERALERAEQCRRTRLVREAEAEMRAADMNQFTLHAYRRARGVAVDEDAVSLFEGEPETVTVFFMDLKNSTEFVTSHDPRWVLMALNQIFAELEAVLRRHQASVNQYLGDGFMAYFRGSEHARRAVLTALEMTAVIREINRPRLLLELPQFEARMGMASGEVVLGYVGTFRKFDYTAIGATTNLAARLQAEAAPGLPCIAHSTYEHVAKLFTFKNAKGRNADLKGFGAQRVWDVTGCVGTQIMVRTAPRHFC